MKVWRRHEHVEEQGAQGVAQAAAAGTPRTELPKQAATYLLANSDADRIGVWIESADDESSDDRRNAFRGIVVDRDHGDTPAEWERLSPEAPLPVELLASGKSVEQDIGAKPDAPILGALVGMQHVVWVPIESDGRLRGVLFAGHRRKNGAWSRAPLQQVAAELALALELEDQRRLARERLEEKAATRQLLTTLASCGPSDALLGSLVASCTGEAGEGGIGAVFAILREWGDEDRESSEHSEPCGLAASTAGTREDISAGPDYALLWQSGDAAWVRAMKNEPLKGIWSRAREARGPITHEAGSTAVRGDAIRVMAIPIEAGEESLGALAGGFRRQAPSPAAQAHLELLAALAAVALQFRRRTRNAARHATQQQTLLDASSGATLLVDEQGQIISMNRAAQELLRDAMPGDSEEAGEQAAAHQLAELFRVRDQQLVTDWLRRSQSGTSLGASEEEPLTAELHTGLRLRLRCLVPPSGGLAGISLDPVVVRDTACVEQAEAQLVNVIEWLEEGVVLFDANHEIRAMNTRFAQIVGLEPQESGRINTLSALIARLSVQAAQPEQFAERWREQAHGGDTGVREEIQLLRPVPRVLERAARPITDAAGRRLGRVEIYRDLTAQRVFQSKLLQTEKLAALGQMVTGVAHELSNPLTSILGYAQRLFVRTDPASRSEEIQQIYQEAERATAIVRQLLMSARESRPERRPVDLNHVVSRALDLQRFSMAAEQVRIEQDLAATLPMVLGDAGQLQQVLMNLIGNSRQAIEQRGKGGVIRLVTRLLGESRVLLEVSDDGPGIPDAILARIFDPFFTTKPAGIGTGLGLAIVLGIVREHGGQVHVSSPPRGGATFTLDFPAARIENTRPAPLPATGPGIGAQAKSRSRPASRIHVATPKALPAARRVMVVEDEPTVARLIADVLEDEGFQVDVLLDGYEALHRAEQEIYDLVICDMKMPNIDGQHFYSSLVESRNPLRKKFLFVTGDVIAAQTHEFLERHQLPHVAKPFRVEELTEKVRLVLADTSPCEPLAATEEKTSVARK